MAQRDNELFREEPPKPTLYRPRRNRLIAGVCAGIARWFGWDPLHVRIGYVAISVLSAAFPGILAYFILWLLMPGDPRGSRSFRLD
jgi:phage shock protein PspC (stress-responsive transcriptional regulator)